MLQALTELGTTPDPASITLHNASVLLVSAAEKAGRQDSARNRPVVQYGLKVATAVIKGQVKTHLLKAGTARQTQEKAHVPWGL